jgi:hypothetical protein
MKIRVGSSLVYTVKVVDQPVGPDGPANAVIDGDNHVIELKASLGTDQRRRELRHEVYHAFDWFWPGTRDAEQEATFSAHVAAEMDAQLPALGGWQALDSLYDAFRGRERQPEVMPVVNQSTYTGERLTPNDFKQRSIPVYSMKPSTVKSIERPVRDSKPFCGLCDSFVDPDALVTNAPLHDWQLGGMVIIRYLFCRKCWTLLRWTEGSTPQGKPNGQVLVAPAYQTKPGAITAFLHSHPRVTRAVVPDLESRTAH